MNDRSPNKKYKIKNKNIRFIKVHSESRPIRSSRGLLPWWRDYPATLRPGVSSQLRCWSRVLFPIGKGTSQQNMAWKMVQYLHFRILKFPFPWRLGWLEIDPVEIDLVTDASVVNKNGDVTVVQHVSDALTQQYLQDAPLKHMCFETFNCRCIHHKSSSCCSCKPTEMYHKSNVNPNFSG